MGKAAGADDMADQSEHMSMEVPRRRRRASCRSRQPTTRARSNRSWPHRGAIPRLQTSVYILPPLRIVRHFAAVLGLKVAAPPGAASCGLQPPG